jgi:RecA/RadA recombinase
MNNARREALLSTMRKINKDQGQFMDFADNLDNTEVIKIGIPSIDKFVGGFKKGAFTVAWGGMSCGKSTLALQAIANAQKEGSICVYIDMERSFSKERAIQLGVNLQELVLISNCQTAEEALTIIRTLSKDKVCDFLVLDSIQAMSPKGEQENKGKERDLAEAEMAQLARTLSKFFRIVSPDVFKAKIAVLLIGQCRMSLGSFIVRADLSGGEALKHWSYQTIFMRRGQGADAPSQKVIEYYADPDKGIHKESKNVACGFDAVLKLTKTKSASSAVENSEIHVPFTFEKGFVESVNFYEQIQITGTEEEKIIITKHLIKKGILKPSSEELKKQEELEDALAEQEREKVEPTLIPPTIPVVERKFTKEEIKVLDTPKKKGRPKKEK